MKRKGGWKRGVSELLVGKTKKKSMDLYQANVVGRVEECVGLEEKKKKAAKHRERQGDTFRPCLV